MIPIMSVLASFLVVGLPILLLFLFFSLWSHCRARRQKLEAKELSTEEQERLNSLNQTAERLERRIQVLETILDQSVPEWRKGR